jgi:ribokinase
MRSQVVAVVGSVNIDTVMEVDSAPDVGETLIGRGVSDVPGGKGGNQAVAAARRATAYLVASIGEDSEGASIVSNARMSGVRVDHVVGSSARTGRAFIQVASDGENRIIVMPLANAELTPEWVTARLNESRPDVVLTQFEIPFDAVTAAAHWAAEHGARFILNPSPVAPVPGWMLMQADPLVVNVGEARSILADTERAEGHVVTDDDPARLARSLGPHCTSLVVTAGPRGAILWQDGELSVVPGRRVTVRDTTGAGDEFVGRLAGELALGANLQQAAQAANEAAADLVQLTRAERIPSGASSHGDRTELEHTPSTEGLVRQLNIGRHLARVGIEAALAESERRGLTTCTAVLDAGGHLVSFDRMDGAPFQTIGIAQQKAYSVAGNLTSGHDFWDGIKDDPWLVHGVQSIPDLSFLGGGVPVLYDGVLIGAVGTSGRSTMAEDRAIAEAAVAAILDRLSGSHG